MDGNVVTDNERIEKNGTVLTFPKKIIVADKIGCNTSTKIDGNMAATKIITKKGTVPQQMDSNKCYQFTFFPFMSATGESVCYIAFYKSEKNEQKFDLKMRIVVKTNPSRYRTGKIDFRARSSPGNYFQSDQFVTIIESY